jgi:hypothetical protein
MSSSLGTLRFAFATRGAGFGFVVVFFAVFARAMHR